MTTEPASRSKKRPRNEEISVAKPEDSVITRDEHNPNIFGDEPPTAAAPQLEDVPLATGQLMDLSPDEDMEDTERLILCTNWRVHVDLILETRSIKMLKELIEKNLVLMLAKLNTKFSVC